MKRISIICTIMSITMLLTGCGTNSMPQTEQPSAPNGTIAPDSSVASETSYAASEESVATTPPTLPEVSIISIEDAKRIALDKVPGATTEHIRRLEKDYENGRFVYDGEIHFEQYEYDFEIDAQDGTIREWDAEPINDGIL